MQAQIKVTVNSKAICTTDITQVMYTVEVNGDAQDYWMLFPAGTTANDAIREARTLLRQELSRASGQV